MPSCRRALAKQWFAESLRRTSETPTTTTSQKSIAIHLQFVLQSPPICIAVLSVPLHSEEREILSVLLPFVSQYASHLHRNTPPICIAVLLGKSWWWWSPGCLQNRLCMIAPPPPSRSILVHRQLLMIEPVPPTAESKTYSAHLRGSILDRLLKRSLVIWVHA